MLVTSLTSLLVADLNIFVTNILFISLKPYGNHLKKSPTKRFCHQYWVTNIELKKFRTISWWLKFRVFDSMISLYIHKLHHIPEFPFKVSVCCRKDVPDFGPKLPEPPVFKADATFRQFLLCKLINAETACYSSTRWDMLRQRNRSVFGFIKHNRNIFWYQLDATS